MCRQYKISYEIIKYIMIVAKFGGTAVTPHNFLYVKRIVTDAHIAVVVSAVGKEFKEDVKVTDMLLNYFDMRDETIWQTVADKYRRLVYVNGIDVDVESLLSDAKRRALTYDKWYCASLGEELSARVTAAYLKRNYIEAEKVLRFDCKGELLIEETYANICSAFSDNGGVMGGFYGGNAGGRRTFSRGGGDVTGAIVAAALNAALYENWTDVNGVCIADPAKVSNVATVDEISYREMRLLSLSGAEVLHPDAIAPCEERGIPIKIGNFFNPNGASTRVGFCPSRCKLLSVTEKKVGHAVVTTVLHSYPKWQIVSCISQFLHAATDKMYFFDDDFCIDPDISSLEFADNIVKLYSGESILKPLYKFLI